MVAAAPRNNLSSRSIKQNVRSCRPLRLPLCRQSRRLGRAALHPRPHGGARPRRRRRMAVRGWPHRLRPSPACHHRLVGSRRATDGERRRQNRHRLQRRDLQLPCAARGSGGERIRFPHRIGHRGAAAALCAKGAAMVRDLRGMFAFGLWDGDKQGLLLARDPYGIKPLYYADDGWTLRFASQVKALVAGVASPSIPIRPAGPASSCSATCPSLTPSIAISAPCRPARRYGSIAAVRMRPNAIFRFRKSLPKRERPAATPPATPLAHPRGALRQRAASSGRRCAGRCVSFVRRRFRRAARLDARCGP